MGTASQTATKQDLKDLKVDIVDQISAVISDAMTSIGMNFNRLEDSVAGLKNDFSGMKNEFSGLKNEFSGLKNDVNTIKVSQIRMEQKLDSTIDHIDAIEIRVQKLENKLV